jgi:diguanylate cyclase (GGDEF)-like protein/putative nucleotidyltransferase with HDIG domain/PAS domain S-box-containing protein
VDFIFKNAPISILVVVKEQDQFKIIPNLYFKDRFGFDYDEIVKAIKLSLSPYIERAFLSLKESINTIISYQNLNYNITLCAIDTEQLIIYIYDHHNYNLDLLIRNFDFLVDDFVFIVSEDYLILDIFTSHEEKLFVNKNESINRSIKEVFDQKMSKEIITKLKEAKQNLIPVDYFYQSPNHQYFYHAKIRYDEKAVPPRFIIKSVDISEETKAMESYKQLNQHYQEMSMMTKTFLWETDQNGKYTFLDETYEQIMGYQRLDVIHEKRFIDFFEPLMEEQYKNTITDIFEQRKAIQNFKNVKVNLNKDHIHLLTNGIPKFDSDGNFIGYRGIDRDVTEQVNLNESMKKTEFLNQILFKHTPVGLAWFDIKGNVVASNEHLKKIFGESINHILENNLLEIQDHHLRELVKDTLKGFKGYYENKYVNDFDQTIHFRAIFIPLQDQHDHTFGGICIVENMTEYYENKIEYEELKTVDRLTNTFRRTYFHEYIHQPSHINKAFGLIIADINGLKYLNEAFGLDFGDQVIREVAQSISRVIDQRGVVFRVGGDSFVVLIEEDDVDDIDGIIKNLKSCFKKIQYQQVQISVSMGFAVKSKNESFEPIILKAEEMLNKNKVLDGTSVNVETINLMMNTLFEKSRKFMEHSRRVSLWSEKLAKAADLEDFQIKQVKLAALLHDIGKVNVDAYLLNKIEPLTKNEIELLRKHPEVGYRILQAVERYEEIAQIVLEHHERFDGNGYPEGKKGKDISIGARILAISDSFDAMLDERPYRKQFTRDQAIQELIDNKHKQFDPELVDIFIKKVLKAQEK